MATARRGTGRPGVEATDAGPLASLDRGERRLAALVAAGRTDAEIATALDVGAGELEAALGGIFRKLRIASRTELALLASRSAGPHA